MDDITFKEVCYSYEDGRCALENLDFTIKRGERVALVGPNGAGKSTLLHLLAGLFIPSKGTVDILGVRLSKKDAAQARRHVGLLFQDPDDQIFMPTVAEDVAFGPTNMGLEEAEVMRRVEEALRMTAMESYRDRVPHHLSLGEKKRVAMSGVLAMSPEVLLLDEPTANLDPQGRRDLINVLQDRKETVIIATHDLSVAFHLTDRVMVLKTKLLYDGSYRGLVENEKVLQEARLELPSFSRLMQKWASETGKVFPPPLTVDEALGVLKDKYCCRDHDSKSH